MMTTNDEIKTISGPIELLGRSKRVDHLPLVAQVLDKLRIARIIDERVEDHPDREISVGACVQALILTILMGSHTLYRVADSLRHWDLSLLFGEDIEPELFNDDRLGRALDQVFKTGISSVNTAVILAAIKSYDLDVSLLHFDTTTLSVHGEYLNSEAVDAEDPDSAPHLTYGHSKDKRPDLKQILFGLTVSNDGYVPLLGRMTSGNRSDTLENRFNLTRIKEVIPAPESITMTADSKLFCGENLLLAKRYGLSIVTLMPKNLNCWTAAFDEVKSSLATAPVLREQVKIDDHGEESLEETWRGLSVQTVHNFRTELEDGRQVEQRIEVRALVISSTALEKKKQKSRDRLLEKERKTLAALDKRFSQKSQEYRCFEDAEQAAQAAQKKANLFHQSRFQIVEQKRKAKRAQRGRPRKDELAAAEYSVFTVVFSHRFDQQQFDEWLLRESSFILATLPESSATDRALLALYKGQCGVEGAFKFMKGPASVAPIFLKNPERIASLGLIYVLALMTYALIQRQIRASLDRAETTIPGNRGRTATPTTQVLFRLFEGITSLPIRLQDGTEVRLLEHITTEQVAVLKLLGNDLLTQPEVRARISKPRRGERGYKPPPGSFAAGRRRPGSTGTRRVRRSPTIDDK